MLKVRRVMPIPAYNEVGMVMSSTQSVRRDGEARRLQRLRDLNILDSVRESFSDAIAVAAAAIANTPISALVMVDADRQWFKASCGLDLHQTTRDISFCTHAIIGVGGLVVRDTLLDARFAANPLVIGAPHIRFYAGFPLVVNGDAVGSLCVIDDRPRELTSEQTRRLQTLAAGTSAWLTACRVR